MKQAIHPSYNGNCTVTCACGNTFVTGSTKDEINTEICSACHPFFTGKQNLVDTAGRLEKYEAKMAKVKAAAEQHAKTKAAKAERKAKAATKQEA